MRNIDKVRKLTIENRELELELENVKMDYEKAKYELGRYKKAVETREAVIGKLKEEIAGQYEVGAILSAYLSILIKEQGAVEIPKEDIKARIGKYGGKIDETESSYIISIVDIESGE